VKYIYITVVIANVALSFVQIIPGGGKTIIHAQKPKIVNSIHSSTESLKHHNTRASMKSKNSQDKPVETIELVSLSPTNKQMLLSGKR